MRRTFTTIAILTLTTTAGATYGTGPDFSGRFFGLVSRGGLDISGDGVAGRMGNLPVVDSVFRHAGIVVDSELTNPSDPQGSCDAGEVEITPFGYLTLTTSSGNSALFATIDSTETLCYGVEPEVVHLDITDGRGWFEGATGRIEATLPDDVLLAVDGYGFPSVVYTHDATFEAWVD